jgi:hypothetical protein
MKVIGVDPNDIPVSNFSSEIVPPDRLDEVLPKAATHNGLTQSGHCVWLR